ncbi:protein CAJ1 isoform X7 [Spinacia oleracea]|uniref:Protein CAJ1 isoform X7 n=1 Tax=Spinacia oleracea TaxID=3562 RepID=A0ABM3QS58_SPIOL|nr:protein CAJ1 isoform X7 [Spinacia oleracea]
MKSGEARLLLGFPPNSRPTPSQVKAAYKRKVWDVHPDLFPVDKASYAESQFKMISEAYKCLLTAGGGPRGSSSSGRADWGTKGAWRKTSSFSWPTLPSGFVWNSWTWRYKCYQGL